MPVPYVTDSYEASQGTSKVIPHLGIQQIKHLRWFVVGAMIEEYQKMPSMKEVRFETTPFQMHLADNMDVVIGFLTGRRELDASVSDFQANLAREAKALFPFL